MVDPGTPAFRIADLSTLWLTVHAFERDAVRIQRGTPARVTFPALPGTDRSPGTSRWSARQVVHRVAHGPRAHRASQPQELLRPGMSATAALPIGAGGAPILAVPVAAVQRVGDELVRLPPEATPARSRCARSGAGAISAARSRSCRACARARRSSSTARSC